MAREKEKWWDSSEERGLEWTESIGRKCRIFYYRPLDSAEMEV